jgi:hypothetical protein
MGLADRKSAQDCPRPTTTAPFPFLRPDDVRKGEDAVSWDRFNTLWPMKPRLLTVMNPRQYNREALSAEKQTYVRDQEV